MVTRFWGQFTKMYCLGRNEFLWQDTLITEEVPEAFNPLEALRIIGYDIKNPENAVKSFQLHFVQKEITGILNEEEKKILFNLYRKYL